MRRMSLSCHPGKSRSPAAMARACKETGASVTDYTAAPVYTTEKTKGHHQWAIAFDRVPNDIQVFAQVLDRELCNENSDYQAKRTGDIFLAPLRVDSVSQTAFDKFLLSTGKLGGQRKIPRLRNDRKIIEQIINFDKNQ